MRETQLTKFYSRVEDINLYVLAYCTTCKYNTRHISTKCTIYSKKD